MKAQHTPHKCKCSSLECEAVTDGCFIANTKIFNKSMGFTFITYAPCGPLAIFLATIKANPSPSHTVTLHKPNSGPHDQHIWPMFVNTFTFSTLDNLKDGKVIANIVLNCIQALLCFECLDNWRSYMDTDMAALGKAYKAKVWSVVIYKYFRGCC